MKVACIQPQIFQDRNKCYIEIEQILKNLLEKNGKYEIICLPERWVPFFKNSIENFQSERGDDYVFIKNLAKKYNIKILSGAIWEKRPNSEKPAITCYFLMKTVKKLVDKTKFTYIHKNRNNLNLEKN